MNKCLATLVIYLGIVMLPFGIYAQQKGEVIFKSGFDSKSDIDNWERLGKAKVIDKEGVSGLRINSKIVKYQLPVEKIKGAKVMVKYRVKAKDISTPPNPWNGIKVMLHSVLPWEDVWQQADLPPQTTDWKEGAFYTYVPAEATAVELIMGMENVTGKVWVDNVEVSIVETSRTIKAEHINTGKRFVGHDDKRLRGVMVNSAVADSDLYELAKWKVNLIRWQLTWNGFPNSHADTADRQAYLAWLDGVLKRVDEGLPLCRKLGIRVVVDLHTLPGGYDKSTLTNRLFQNKEWQDVFRGVWKDIAQRYKNEPIIWGYDLANEPAEGIVPEGVMDWRQLATATINDIRAIDDAKAIIFEAAPAGTQQALSNMEPLPVKDVVYSFHMYTPPQFTLQNINGGGPQFEYPGYIDGRKWDIETLRKVLSPVIKWQKDYNVHLYVGEFSAIRWAPGESAYYYMNDCIRIFEELGWDWTYHAFREWNGWSAEHDRNRDNNQPATEAPERKKLLLEWFDKNER